MRKVLIVLSAHETTWRQAHRKIIIDTAFAEHGNADCVELTDETGHFEVFSRDGRLINSDWQSCNQSYKNNHFEVVATLRHDCRMLV